jgi:hypothetical protein
LIKASTVIRFTLKIRAISVFETFLANNVRMVSSCPDNFTLLDLRPLGLPSITPSARFLARASLVRWLMRLRSISADSPNAKASDLRHLKILI